MIRTVLVGIMTAGAWAAGKTTAALVVAGLATFFCFVDVLARPVRTGGFSYRASGIITALIIGMLVVAEAIGGIKVGQSTVACPPAVRLDVQQRFGLKGALKALFGAGKVDYSVVHEQASCLRDAQDQLNQSSGTIGLGAQDLMPGQQTVRLGSVAGVVETPVRRPPGLLEVRVPQVHQGGFKGSVSIDSTCGDARQETAAFSVEDDLLSIELGVRAGDRFERLGGTLGAATTAPDGTALKREWTAEGCSWSRLHFQVSLLDFAYDIQSPQGLEQTQTLELKIGDHDGSEAKVTVTGHLTDTVLATVLEPYHQAARGKRTIKWAPEVAPLGLPRPYLIVEKDDAYGWHLAGAPLKAVQLVVGIERVEKTVGQCYYSDGWYGSSEDRKRSDRIATIYEARSGKQRAQQTFYGSYPVCPARTSNTVVGKPPERATIETWAAATILRMTPPGPPAAPAPTVAPAAPRPVVSPVQGKRPAEASPAAPAEAPPSPVVSDPPSASFEG